MGWLLLYCAGIAGASVWAGYDMGDVSAEDEQRDWPFYAMLAALWPIPLVVCLLLVWPTMLGQRLAGKKAK